MTARFRKPVRERWDDALSRVSWGDFERRVGAYYEGQGYRVEYTGTGSGLASTDGGVDLKLFRGTEYIVVQCKHWNALQVPHNPVHELIGVMHTQGANGAILVTSGEFTRAALESASRFPGITLVDGPTVRRMIGPIEEAVLAPASLVASEPPWMAVAGRRRASPRRGKGRDAALYAVALGATAASLALWAFIVNSIRAPLQALPVPAVSAPHRAVEPGAPFHGYATGAAASDMSRRGMPPAAPRHDTTPQTPLDLKDWERKNAEAMKILEKTTPVMQSP
jgi:restriction system protein